MSINVYEDRLRKDIDKFVELREKSDKFKAEIEDKKSLLSELEAKQKEDFDFKVAKEILDLKEIIKQAEGVHNNNQISAKELERLQRLSRNYIDKSIDLDKELKAYKDNLIRLKAEYEAEQKGYYDIFKETKEKYEKEVNFDFGYAKIENYAVKSYKLPSLTFLDEDEKGKQ